MLASKAGDTAEWLFAVVAKVCFAFADVSFCSRRELPAGAMGQEENTGFGWDTRSSSFWLLPSCLALGKGLTSESWCPYMHVGGLLAVNEGRGWICSPSSSI